MPNKDADHTALPNEKSDNDNTTSAEHVEQHLQALSGNEDMRELRYYSQEQPFSADFLGSVINEARLTELLAESDAFISHLQGEMQEFDEGELGDGLDKD
ncbi:hypothetical protein [Psychrobacter aestuarii]|uniref:Uncharacterized protein n=1 Tax=Psychrobacter aestuarii TaxID=556327 RepID=A0ABP3FAZ5_9GAMM|nr:hypothetical protein [Psychrobacter aestuarii]